MDEMKRRFANAVAGKLAGTAESAAKNELVEELSDNLYRRYLDMIGSGIHAREAFDRALDDLGDTDELVEYLNSLAPEEPLPELTLHPDEKGRGDWPDLDDIMGIVDGSVRDALEQAGEDLSTAREERGRTGGGFSYSLESDATLMFDGDACTVDDSGQPLRGVDIELGNGDVSIRILDDADAPVGIGGDVDSLEVKVTQNGVLAIRQGRTASSTFFFLRGLSSADVELCLPRRRWEFLQVTTGNGDVDLDGPIDLERLSVRTTNGDLRAQTHACGKLFFKSASGDLDMRGLTGSARVETISGDAHLDGHMEQAVVSSVSGDVELEGSVREARLSSVSGDVRLTSSLLPDRLELSSKSGDCAACIPDAEAFTLRFKTTSGDFRSDFPLRRTSRGAIYGDGGARTFSMTSISGDLNLEKN